MCTHNGARFVEQQLRSIVGQRTPPTEIVVSDDASSDDTLAVVARVVAEIDSSIRVTIIENGVALGVRANFEQALLACGGDLIALSDQDDVWHEDRLDSLRERFDNSPDLLLVSSNAALVDQNGVSLGHTLFEALEISASQRESLNGGGAFDELARRNLVTGATSMIRRSLLTVAVPIPAPWLHDEWLAIIAAATGELGVLDRVLTDYRQHDTNQVGATRLGIAGKISRLREPRGNRYDYLLERATVLRDRLQLLGPTVPAQLSALAEAKIAHQSARARLPAARWRRVAPVAREVASGRYARFSRGTLDIIRDLVQPV